METLPPQEQFYRAPARFGSIPPEAEPKGWDRRQGYYKFYPRIDLPTQIVERVHLGNRGAHEPNRLIWGDKHELCSFNDIWEGGLDGYLIWYKNIRIHYFDKPLEPATSQRMKGQMKDISDVWNMPSINYLEYKDTAAKGLTDLAGSIRGHFDAPKYVRKVEHQWSTPDRCSRRVSERGRDGR